MASTPKDPNSGGQEVDVEDYRIRNSLNPTADGSAA